MKTVKLSDFNAYLEAQVGEPYVWGGQHLKLTPDNYIAVITKKESDPTNRENAIAFCEKKFSEGAEVLYAYDCSGLGMYYLQNVTGVYSHDMSANSMYRECKAIDTPVNGSWVFRFSDGKATHIGYMVSDTECTHAKGRKYGVVKERFDKSYWHKYGKPKCIEVDAPTPEPTPTPEPDPPEPTPSGRYVKVLGGSVRVRKGGSVLYKTIGIAHRGEQYPLLGTAGSGWYMIGFEDQVGYITNKPKYTEVIEYGE